VDANTNKRQTVQDDEWTSVISAGASGGYRALLFYCIARIRYRAFAATVSSRDARRLATRGKRHAGAGISVNVSREKHRHRSTAHLLPRRAGLRGVCFMARILRAALRLHNAHLCACAACAQTHIYWRTRCAPHLTRTHTYCASNRRLEAENAPHNNWLFRA